MDYIDRIKNEREDHDETQRVIASGLSISQSQYWMYETRKHEMPIRLLIAICNRYQVSADYILGLPYSYRRPKREKQHFV